MPRGNLMTSISVFASAACVHSFSPLTALTPYGIQSNVAVANTQLFMTEETTPPSKKEQVTDNLVIPLSFDEMIRIASSAMNDAFDRGFSRQMCRVLLPRDPSNVNIGNFFENDANVDDTQGLVLVPLDESWQGGIMQLYRAAAPTCQALLRRFSRNKSGIPPRIQEDRSVDESGVDGVGLWVTQNSSPEDDVSCFLQPTQETIDTVETISKQAGKRLVLLLNPQWRFADDALDAASRNDSFLGNVASLLGGKGNSLKRLDDLGFESVFTLEGYVCRGGNIRLMKRFDSDWAVFAENDSASGYIKVGTSTNRPTYQEVDRMLNDNGITLKYARDMGFAPKL